MDAKWYHRAVSTLTIKQIPAELVQRLKERAKLNGRSMNREVIACLESVVSPRLRTAEELIAEAKAVWEALGVGDLPPYDPAWKNEGRP